MVGRVASNELELTEVHRFPNAPVRLPDGLHWDILGLYREVLAGLREATRHGWDWPDFLEYSIGPHREVLDAVMAHDPDRAEDAMRRLVIQSQASFDYPPGSDNPPSRPLTRA